MKTLIVIAALITLSNSVIAQKQGICGKVVWTSGNQMPGPGLQSSKPAGIVREVYIYEATATTKVTEASGFYSSIQTKLVKKVKTKKDGTFCVKLPVGTYSVFVKEGKGLWANIFDGQGIINPVTVVAKSCTPHTININYQAAY